MRNLRRAAFAICGAPVSQKFAGEVGADAYTSNASDAADAAKAYLESKAD